jgi:hypothetical protein
VPGQSRRAYFWLRVGQRWPRAAARAHATVEAIRGDPGPSHRSTAAGASALAIVLVAGALFAWIGAHVEPGWADRYMNVFTGPVLLLAGAGLAAAGRAGLVALAAALILWALDPAPATKSNVRAVATAAASRLDPGDAVVVTHPEQIAVVSHYLRHDSLRFATPLGTTADPSAFDWRDAEPRLRSADPRPVLDALLEDGTPRQVVIVRPRGNAGPIDAPWRAAVARATQRWIDLANSDPRLEFQAAVPKTTDPIEHRTDVQMLTYRVRVP